MVMPAQRSQIAQAGPAALVVGDRVIVVALGGGPPATGKHAGVVLDSSEMTQRGRGLVGGGFQGMVTAAGQRRDGERQLCGASPGAWPGAGPWLRSGSRPGARWGLRAGSWSSSGLGTAPASGRAGVGAAVGKGPAVRAGKGQAPLGAGVSGEPVGDGTGIGGVQRPVSGHVAGGVGLAEPGGQGHSEVHPPDHGAAQPGPAAVTGPTDVTRPAAAGPTTVTRPTGVTGPTAVTGPTDVTGPTAIAAGASAAGPTAAGTSATVGRGGTGVAGTGAVTGIAARVGRITGAGAVAGTVARAGRAAGAGVVAGTAVSVGRVAGAGAVAGVGGAAAEPTARWAVRAGLAWEVLPGGGEQGGGWGAGEQGEVDLGAQGVQGALRPGRLQLFGQGGQVGISGQHSCGGQIAPGQRGGARGLGPAFHPGLPERLFLAGAGGGGVGGQHRPADGQPQLARRLPGGSADDRLFDGGGVLAGEAGEFVGDDFGAGQVDVAGGEGGADGGQAVQRGREVEQVVGGAAGQS